MSNRRNAEGGRQYAARSRGALLPAGETYGIKGLMPVAFSPLAGTAGTSRWG